MNTPNPGRVAALRQVALFWACYLAILLVASVGKSAVPAPWKDLAWGALCTLALWGLTRLFLRRTGRSGADIGFQTDRGTPWKALIGLGMGVGVYGANLILVSGFVAPIRLEWGPASDPVAAAVAVLGFVALSSMEELGFRGLPLRALMPQLGAWKAQAVVAVAFGLCHLAFGWSVVSVLTGVVPSALLFGAAAAASGGLAMPIALHAGLNIARWAVGENPSTGLWRMSAEESAQARIAAVAPFIGVAVSLALAAAIGSWQGWRRSRASTGGTAPRRLPD